MRAVAICACLLAACCAEAPTVTAEQIENVKRDYLIAYLGEARMMETHCVMGQCDSTIESVRRLDYDAAAALIAADQQRTAGTLRAARAKVDAFAKAIP